MVAAIVVVGAFFALVGPLVPFLWTAPFALVALVVVADVAARWRARAVPPPSPYAAAAALDAELNGPIGSGLVIAFHRGALAVSAFAFGIIGALAVSAAVIDWRDPFADAIAAVVAWFALGRCLVAALQLARREPALIVDNAGIVLAGRLGPARRVGWPEVRSVTVRWRGDGEGGPPERAYLVVELARPGDYLARFTGLRGVAERLRWRLSSDPLRIGIRQLALPADEAAALVKEAVHDHLAA